MESNIHPTEHRTCNSTFLQKLHSAFSLQLSGSLSTYFRAEETNSTSVYALSFMSPSMKTDRNEAWKYICIAHLIRCFADRSYTFFLPLFISKHCASASTLRPTAVITIVQNLAVALLSTTVSKIFRSSKAKDGRKLFERAVLLENVAVAFGGALFFISFSSGTEKSHVMCENPLSSSYFLIALFCGAVDAIFSSFLSMIVSKEWVARIFHSPEKDKENIDNSELSKANARLSQLDLGIATVSPLLISWEINKFGYNKVLVILIGQHLVGALVIIICAKRATTLYPQLLLQHIAFDKNHNVTKKDTDYNKSFQHLFTCLPLPTQLVSIAYTLLYVTVLSPGAMLNSWMNSLHGGVSMNERMIAIASSTSQFCGAVATIISPYIIKSTTSLLHASLVTQWSQSACILIGAFYFYHLNKTNSDIHIEHDSAKASSSHLACFLIAISVSRIGLWTFDLVERQLMQESVSKPDQNLFFNGEKSVTQALSLGMMGLCYIFSDPQSFPLLVVTSAIAVSCASLLIGISLMLSMG